MVNNKSITWITSGGSCSLTAPQNVIECYWIIFNYMYNPNDKNL